MRMQIPSIGDRIRLLQDWTFTLHAESRNETLGKALGIFGPNPDPKNKDHWAHELWSDGVSSHGLEKRYEPDQNSLERRIEFSGRALTEVTFPKGTEFTVDRIYIRKGAKEFDSMTLFLGKTPLAGTLGFKKKGAVRFWVKLTDANKMDFEFIEG